MVPCVGASLARLDQTWSKPVQISHDPGVDPVRAGVPMGGVVLIQPDGHIGFRSTSADAGALAALDHHLSSRVRRSSVAFPPSCREELESIRG